MKPNRRSAQRLGAFVLPVLGILLAGCGGRFNDVDGGTSQMPTGGISFSVAGTAYIEGQVTTRAIAAGDVRLGGASVRVLRRTPAGVFVQQTGTTDAQGHYSLTVDAPAGVSTEDLWEVDVFASGVRVTGSGGATVVTNIILLGIVVPAPGVLLARDTHIASTIVAGNLEALQAAGGRPGAMAQADLNALETTAGSLVRTPAPGTAPVRLSAVSTQKSTADDAHAGVLAGIAEQVVSIYNSIISQVRVTMVGVPTSQVTLAPGQTAVLNAQALDAAGNPVAAGIQFLAESGGSYVTISQSGVNAIMVAGRTVGTAVLVARVAVPGQLELVPKQTKVTVAVSTHPQGSGQGQ